MTERKIYIEKKDIVHTPEEILAAFDESYYSVCFSIERNSELIRKKQTLFAKIYEANPDVIITDADLCILAREPVVMYDQLLLINKNGTMETANKIAKLMTESGIVSYEYRVVTECGIKICFGSIDIKDSPIHRFKGTLLTDGEKPLLLSRHMTKAEKAFLKDQRH